MKKTLSVVLLMLLCISSYSTTPYKNLEAIKGDMRTFADNISKKQMSNSQRIAASDVATPDATTNAYTWGVIEHEDGYTWYYTQTFEEREWYIGSTDINIFDNDFNAVASLHIEIPEDMNVNDIQPLNFITSSFFDTDESTLELPVFVHAIENYQQVSKIGVYRLNGEKIMEYDAYAMLFFDADDYKRVLAVSDKRNSLNVNVLTPAIDNEQPTVEHTFECSQDLLYYIDGPFINYNIIDGEPYYTTAHFEVPCMNGYDPSTYVPIQVPGNNLVITTYNTAYEVVDELKVPIDPENELATYGFAALGMLSANDIRGDEFSNDNQRNYIVTHYEYFAQSDSYLYSFKVYDAKGNVVSTIVKDVANWFVLSDVKGFEEQIAFLKADADGNQVLEMIDIQSCNVAAVFPAVVDGYNISATFDRYPVVNDYQYVISISNAEVDANGDAIARIGWYNRDCTVDHYVTFNLGKNAEGFKPYIASYVLSPYLFNTDDKHEYLFLAMNKRADGSEIVDKRLYLADEDGNILRTIKPTEGDEIEFSSGDIFDYDTPSPKMLLSFYNGDTESFEMLFYNLPFDKYTSGGDGTPNNPYVITTPGELAHMYLNATDAHYTLSNDIDMNEYIFPYYAPAEMKGVFEGNNYTVSNISLTEDGIWGSLNNAVVRNLQIESPVITMQFDTVGVLASTAYNAAIENVHIYNAHFNNHNQECNVVGGLLGYSSNSSMNAISVLHATATTHSPISNIGGVVGVLDNSHINATVTSGDICSEGAGVAGIASIVSTNSTISNSHTHWNIDAASGVAGIANISQGKISHCYTQGTYNMTENAASGSGIVETLNADDTSATTPAIKGCVTTQNIIVRNVSESGVELLNNYSLNNDNHDANSQYGAYCALENWNRSFFENLGYAYGNTNDSPWNGDELPILYFENEKQNTPSITINNNAIRYDGVMIEAADAHSITLINMQGTVIASVNDSELSVDGVLQGIYIAVAVDAQGTTVSRKIVVQ